MAEPTGRPMLFETPDDFIRAPRHAVTVFGMSGVGKTRLSATLQRGGWFHYSVDYRIGTRYMGEFIVDNFKREAMKVPFLRDLLRSDSIYLNPNITFDNLEPLSSYLGAPGDPKRGGLTLKEYQRRQHQHLHAEVSALMDVPDFIERATEIYGYDDFICDTGGSLIEVIDPDNAEDPVVKALTETTVLLYIRGTERDAADLVARFKDAPKPMYYQPGFLTAKWAEYRKLTGARTDKDVDPDGFAAWGFEALLRDRLPRYEALAKNFGYVVEAKDLKAVESVDGFMAMMAKAIKRRRS